jgi:hypothetical protein
MADKFTTKNIKVDTYRVCQRNVTAKRSNRNRLSATTQSVTPLRYVTRTFPIISYHCDLLLAAGRSICLTYACFYMYSRELLMMEGKIVRNM